MNTLTLWNQYQTCGVKIIPDINERFMVFMDIIEKWDEEKPLQNHLLNYYKAYQTSNNVKKQQPLTSDHRMLRKLQNEKISPTNNLPKMANDLNKFFLY